MGGTNVDNAENITESGVKEGWLEVKPGKQLDEPVQKLLTLQEEAKSQKKGRWSEDGQSHVRSITWAVDDLRSLVEKYKQQQVDAVVEQVRDGNSIRAFLLPTYEYITVMFSGIKVNLKIFKKQKFAYFRLHPHQTVKGDLRNMGKKPNSLLKPVCYNEMSKLFWKVLQARISSAQFCIQQEETLQNSC